MNATTPLPHLRLSSVEGAERAARAEAARAETAHATAALAAGPTIAILTAFWAYVALSNVLYARSMSVGLDPRGIQHLFAAWDARVLQHVLMYPLLLGCVGLSLRIKWRPIWRAVPAQVLLGLAFSALGSPLLSCAELILGRSESGMHSGMSAGMSGSDWHHFDASTCSIWAASATSFLLTYGFALALVMGFATYRRFKDSELRLSALERAWSGARLAALRMQLSPHTLFNLLHTIRGQIAWDPPAAQQMVVQLGDLLRRLLAAGERDLVPLSDEIEFARLYLELQRQRFADRLSLELPDPGSLPRTWVPSLILQPLVENAVAHGLAGHTGAVVIKVEATASADALRLRVTNTIAAAHHGDAGEPNLGGSSRGPAGRASGGIGLRNVRERLAVHFGERASLEARRTASTDPAAAEADAGLGEWIAELRLPLLPEP